jgi:4-hydroxy-tetrahydrodipicolinate reductase
MKIALIGFGAMGQLVADQARKAGDEIGTTFTSKSGNADAKQLAQALRGHDVAIDFSVGGIVLRNVEAAALAGVPLVEGTTGWKQYEAEAKRIVVEHDGALVYGPNFSTGVHLFYRVVKHAAALFAKIDDYAPFIHETHHSRKRDAPSGTALRIRDLMSEHFDLDIPTSSTRAGFVPGTHQVGFDSEADQILLNHVARSRAGFAAGALLAAHWISGRKGVYEFGEIIDEILTTPGGES